MLANLLKHQLGLKLLVLLGLIAVSPVRAETCHPLNVIGGDGVKVRKTVSPISTLVTNNNWNTDFAVSGGVIFNRYVATVIPENNANYDLKLILKFSDNTTSEFYNKSNVAVKVNKPVTMVGEPRSQTEPYQINVFVGGINAIGNTYTVSVIGCR
ncbi:hypothetical protein Syn7502_03434 [Synechococcus sp. PCC 7502]|uniref:hypothetical protein n=1 Tax=Synechococcus sp. PCC 7502 TaxID=1173263 RepID=UPI00029FE577|nr:hypothetical protein [Synechococcus sp. PCC 7502]AFY75283.1 hypothetical protein Syn7502_03434 [Synechococcus sp. PCC 7502]